MRITKSLILFFLLCVAVFFIVESLMNKLFEDQTPLWKIILVSLISGYGLFHPLLKKGADFKFSDVLKKQKRIIKLSKKIDAAFIEFLKTELANMKFVLSKTANADGELLFYSKMSFKTFGEQYRLTWNENEIHITSSTKFYFDILDYGIAKEQLNAIETLIKKL